MADPMAGAGDMAGGDMAGDSGADSTIVATICRLGDGSYMVYPGDEPSDAGGDEDEMDGGMAGGAGAPGGDGGEPAAGIGEALKATMDILQNDAASAGGPGSAEDQMQAGYAAGPGGSMGQKY